ncbi:MAG: ThiF family adenylyltransferase [Acidobacteriota bacterium]|nr:ThiF family adenylyltransferase [Acidobacteriota bacterium]
MKNRYERQVRFQGWGENGQTKFSDSHAVIVGCGALGTVQAEALARAGIGRLTVIDRDFVELGNLHRQFIFSEQDAADSIPKATAAARRLRQINSEITIESTVAHLEPRNIRELCAGAHLILDATDNFETRYLINDYAVSTRTPWIYGAAIGTYGLSMNILPGDSACLRCVYPDPPAGAQPTCETAGILSPITMMIASLQTAEAMKILAHVEPRRTLLTVDIWLGAFREILAPRDPDCPACARGQFPWLSGERRAPVSLCGQNAVQIHAGHPVDLLSLGHSLAALGEVRQNEFALRFISNGYHLTVFPDGRAIIKGTSDPNVAHAVTARYLGF